MIQEFNGINLFSGDTLRIKRFYHDLLGLSVLSDDLHDFDGAQFRFSDNGPVLFLWDETRRTGPALGPVQLVFRCDNLDRTYAELREKGADVAPPVTTDWGGRELRLRDPDGNEILLLE